MIDDGSGTVASARRARWRGMPRSLRGTAPPGRTRGPRWRLAIAAGSAVLAAAALSACGAASAGGPVTLNFYLYPDGSGATQKAITNCDAQSHGAYRISYQQLPQAADGQRQQMVRRL